MNPLQPLLEKAKRSGTSYNTLDAMKLFAIVNMTIDHVGAYFFPEMMWLRALGRITFPVWFFLVGFSRSREIPRSLWIYALLLVLIQPWVNQPIFPLNALVTVIICRLCLNWVEYKAYSRRFLPECIVACVFLVPTDRLFEYGGLAMMFTLLGRLAREEKRPKHYATLAVVAFLCFLGWECLVFPFHVWQVAYVAVGTALVVYWLAKARIATLVGDWTKNPAMQLISILSRNTLPYYFYHRAAFLLLASWLWHIEKVPLLRWF